MSEQLYIGAERRQRLVKGEWPAKQGSYSGGIVVERRRLERLEAMIGQDRHLAPSVSREAALEAAIAVIQAYLRKPRIRF